MLAAALTPRYQLWERPSRDIPSGQPCPLLRLQETFFFWLCEPVQTEINTPLKRAGPSWNFILMAEKNMKCPWFAGHFLICFPLDFPRHIREVKPGADNSDLHLCGCDAVLAPADPLHPQAEEGKNRQASPCGTCLSLPAWPMSENFSQDDGIAESTKKKKKLHFTFTAPSLPELKECRDNTLRHMA